MKTAIVLLAILIIGCCDKQDEPVKTTPNVRLNISAAEVPQYMENNFKMEGTLADEGILKFRPRGRVLNDSITYMKVNLAMLTTNIANATGDSVDLLSVAQGEYGSVNFDVTADTIINYRDAMKMQELHAIVLKRLVKEWNDMVHYLHSK